MATQRPPLPIGPRVRANGAPLRRARASALKPRISPLAPFLQVAPVAVLIIGLMLPVEVRVNLAGQTIYAYRMAWLLFAPWIIYNMLAGRFQFRFGDLFVSLAAIWIVLSFAVIDGLATGIPAGLAVALDILIPYLITRHTIRSFNDFRVLLILLAPVAFGVAALMVVESVTHKQFIRSGAASIFGAVGEAEYGRTIKTGELDTRFGLMRASGPFSHPILAGVFFAGLMPLYYFSRLRGWPFWFGMASGLGALFTLSSSAYVGILIFGGLAAYDWLQKRVTFLNWPTFLAAVGALFLILQVLSKNGLIAVLIRYTVNPATGYYRLLIWEFGSKSVQKHPWFGIGYEPFEKLQWMTDSVDTIWLAIAIRNGFIPAVLLGGAVLFAIAMLIRTASRGVPSSRPTAMGIAITLSIFFILGFTVSFFGGLMIWFVMLLAVGITFGYSAPARVGPAVRLRVPERAA